MKKNGLVFSVDVLIFMMVVTCFIYVGVIRATDFMTSSRNERAIAETASIGALISEYRQEVGVYPNNLDTLKNVSGQYGPWLKEVPKDPWNPGNQYKYKYNTSGYAVYSIGKNKKDTSSASAIGSGNVGFVGR